MSSDHSVFALPAEVDIHHVGSLSRHTFFASQLSNLELDWSGVQRVDSSALAFVCELKRQHPVATIRHSALPSALKSLAKLYNVELLFDSA